MKIKNKRIRFRRIFHRAQTRELLCIAPPSIVMIGSEAIGEKIDDNGKRYYRMANSLTIDLFILVLHINFETFKPIKTTWSKDID